MELDFTSQLQPAIRGLLIALVITATGLVAVADRRQIDLLSRDRRVHDWRRRWRLARASWDRGLVRLAAIARYLTNQLLLRERRKA